MGRTGGQVGFWRQVGTFLGGGAGHFVEHPLALLHGSFSHKIYNFHALLLLTHTYIAALIALRSHSKSCHICEHLLTSPHSPSSSPHHI